MESEIFFQWTDYRAEILDEVASSTCCHGSLISVSQHVPSNCLPPPPHPTHTNSFPAPPHDNDDGRPGCQRIILLITLHPCISYHSWKHNLSHTDVSITCPLLMANRQQIRVCSMKEIPAYHCLLMESGVFFQWTEYRVKLAHGIMDNSISPQFTQLSLLKWNIWSRTSNVTVTKANHVTALSFSGMLLHV